MKRNILLILILVLSISSFHIKTENVTRLFTPTIAKEIHSVIPHIIDFKDTSQNDTLFEHLSENKIPTMYSRKIRTGVCIDGECRLVRINLFWNTSGRYLGFELPEKEFLSKTEHVKFTSKEYDQLHFLLANPHSELANYSLKDLVPGKDSTNTNVDAVSSATIAAVLDYIVPGAVYTTYTLWHVVYGQTKSEIEKLTYEKLTSEIVLELLNSKILEDQVWALNHISEKMEISGALQNKIMEIISGKDIYLAERSLNALKPNALTSEIQIELSNIFDNSGFWHKLFIIQKLMDAPKLDNYVIKKLSSELKNLNGTLIKTSLELFNTHNIIDEFVAENVAELLKSENRYIANQAFEYLENRNNHDKKISKSIERYRKNNIR